MRKIRSPGKWALQIYFLLREVKPRVERSVNLGEASPQRGTLLPIPRPFTIGPPLTTDGPKDYLFPGGREGNRGRPEACEIQNQRAEEREADTLKLGEAIPASPRLCRAAWRAQQAEIPRRVFRI